MDARNVTQVTQYVLTRAPLTRHGPGPDAAHIIVRRNGVVIGRAGIPISGSIKPDATNAHTLLSEWLGRSGWDRP